MAYLLLIAFSWFAAPRLLQGSVKPWWDVVELGDFAAFWARLLLFFAFGWIAWRHARGVLGFFAKAATIIGGIAYLGWDCPRLG